MGNCIITRRGGSGGEPVFSVIGVTGPLETDEVVCLDPDGEICEGGYYEDFEWWMFSTIKYGTHTITATRSGVTKTATIYVDAEDFFDVEIEFESRTYLYNLGDECTALTGGWTSITGTNFKPVVKNSDNMYLDSNSISPYVSARPITINSIDVTNYSKFVVEYYDVNTTGVNRDRHLDNGISTTSTGSVVGWSTFRMLTQVVNEAVTLELDISNYSGNYWLVANVYGSYNDSGKWIHARIKRIWLE